jgi:amidase
VPLTSLDNDFGPLLDHYLQGLEVSPVRSLKELIEWNAAHAEEELPEGN